jgi:hypothetical protein
LERVKCSHGTKLRTCVRPKQAIFIFVCMRNNFLLIGIGFVLLAFVYWPTNPVQRPTLLPKSKHLIQTVPTTDPSNYTSQLNHCLSDYMDRSVGQGIKACADVKGLNQALRAKQIVAILPNTGYSLDSFTHSYGFLTPYASKVLKEIGRAFADSLANSPLKECELIVTSMTRTKYTVAKLMPNNRTAVRRSPHLNGNAFDFSFSRFKTPKKLNEREQNYLRSIISEILVHFKKEIKIWVTFEAREECLHVVARKGV